MAETHALWHSRWTDPKVSAWRRARAVAPDPRSAQTVVPWRNQGSRNQNCPPGPITLISDATQAPLYWDTCRTQPAAHLCHPDHVSGTGSCMTAIKETRVTAASDTLPTHFKLSVTWAVSTTNSGLITHYRSQSGNPTLRQLLAFHNDRRLARFVSNRPATTERGK